jgi:hypothetical protein
VRHVVKGRNPIVHAAKVITLLEEWFSEYTEKNTSGLVAPRDRSMRFKRVGLISRHSCRQRAFLCRSENQSAGKSTDAKRQFGAAIERIVKANPASRWIGK